MPDSLLRITIIDTLGYVIYDSFVTDETSMDNHLRRPEIEKSNNNKIGKVIRMSNTLGVDYYYIAQRFPSLYVRTALPYDVSLIRSLHANNYFIYAISLLLLVVMILLYVISKNFSIRVQKNEDKLKRELTHNISHELKTPLSGILGYVESIIENPDLPAERQRYFIERTYHQAKRLRELLSDISTINNLDDNKKAYSFEHCNLSEIIEDVISDLRFQIEQKHFTVVQKFPIDIPIKGNRSLLYSIFRNLMDNALLYAGENITVTISLDEKDPIQYHFSFSDNGAGLAQEHLHRIFERFYRVDKGRSRKLGGTGLGLSIVKNAIILHHGSIDVKNRSEGGLIFTFTLRKF
jgi:signal transduction histidine kinase